MDEKTILISKQGIEDLWLIYAGQKIAEEKSVQTWMHRKVEYVVTGGRHADDGYVNVSRVVDLASYKGERKPTTYHQHGNECRAGIWPRGYEGMLIRSGARQLVMLESATVRQSHEIKQLALF